MMYHTMNDKKFLKKMRQYSGEMMQKLCKDLHVRYKISAIPVLIGSGAKNMILQNANEPVDLDYNIVIQRNLYSENEKEIRDAVQTCLNRILRTSHQRDCEDSKSCLTTKLISFPEHPHMKFSIDVAVVTTLPNGCCRLLTHDKINDRYYWTLIPSDSEIKEKVLYIKQHGAWQKVLEEYLKLKNLYLTKNDQTHSSRILYTESVNNVYHHIKTH